MINLPFYYYLVVAFIVLITITPNLPKHREWFITHFVPLEFINTFTSVILGFFLTALLTLNVYNSQLKQKYKMDRDNALNYLIYLDNNLKKVDPDKLGEGISMGFINFDYFDNIPNIGNFKTDTVYFKLIGHLKYLKNQYYEVYNAYLIHPKDNPIRSDEARLINNTINYIKDDINSLRLELTTVDE